MFFFLLVFSPHWTRPASANLVKKEVIFTLFFFTRHYDKAVFRLPQDDTKPLWPGKRENLLGTEPSCSMQGSLPLCQDLTVPHTPPFTPSASLTPAFSIGVTFPSIDRKDLLRGRIKRPPNRF